MPDRGALLGSHPRRQEVDQIAVRTEHAERAIPSIGHLDGQIDDPLQKRRQGQLRGEREPGLEELEVAIAGSRHGTAMLNAPEWTPPRPPPPGEWSGRGCQRAGYLAEKRSH